MTNDAELLSRLGAALAVDVVEPDDAAFAALTTAVRAKRIERTQALQQEVRDERHRILRGGPVRRYAAIAAALAVSPVAACATTAVAGIEPPAPLRPIAELLGLDATPASPDPTATDGPAYESQALGAPAGGTASDGVADTTSAPTSAPAGVPTTTPTPTLPAVERTHTTVPEAGSGPGSAVPNITPGTTVPPVTVDPEPAPEPVPAPEPDPAPAPGNTPPTTGGGGPGASRGG